MKASPLGKKSLLKTSPVTVPYRKKSYHSTVVPIRLASATVRTAFSAETVSLLPIPVRTCSIAPPVDAPRRGGALRRSGLRRGVCLHGCLVTARWTGGCFSIMAVAGTADKSRKCLGKLKRSDAANGHAPVLQDFRTTATNFGGSPRAVPHGDERTQAAQAVAPMKLRPRGPLSAAAIIAVDSGSVTP